MVELVYEFLGIMGLDIFPATLGELIPYFLKVAVGCSILWAVFSMVRYWVAQIFGGRMV